jgi:hypothetical protein
MNVMKDVSFVLIAIGALQCANLKPHLRSVNQLQKLTPPSRSPHGFLVITRSVNSLKAYFQKNESGLIKSPACLWVPQ